MNTRSFINWLKNLSSPQNISEKMRKKYNAVFWGAYPSTYVSIWVKADFQKMEPIDFVAKYLMEMEDESTSEPRRKEIASFVLPMFKEITGKEYYGQTFEELVK